jgi:hypothetical protein
MSVEGAAKAVRADILPNFLVLGAQRCATSWLYFCLKEHPDIYLPHVKELHYFDSHYDKGVEHYRRYYRLWRGQKAIGDITPSYIYKEEAAARIASDLPAARLIVIFRDPAERAFSEYKMYRRNGAVRCDFETAIVQDRQYIERGFYYSQLMHYLNSFPREKILVLIFEDLEKDPVAYLQKIFTFLGVREDFVPTLAHDPLPSESLTGGWQAPASMLSDFARKRLGLGFFVDAYTRSPVSALSDRLFRRYRPALDDRAKPRQADRLVMSDDTRALLGRAFKDEKEKLAILLGRELSAWG